MGVRHTTYARIIHLFQTNLRIILIIAGAVNGAILHQAQRHQSRVVSRSVYCTNVLKVPYLQQLAKHVVPVPTSQILVIKKYRRILLHKKDKDKKTGGNGKAKDYPFFMTNRGHGKWNKVLCGKRKSIY